MIERLRLMSDMKHAVTLELIPAYALGALDPVEEASVADHLVGCAQCRQELQAYEAVVDALPLAAAEVSPPVALKHELMARVQSTAASGQTPTTGWLERLRSAWASAFSSARWQPVALALIALLAFSNILLWQRLNEVAERPGPIVLMGTEAAPDAWGLLAPGQAPAEAVLVVDGLPPLEPSLQYQLWLVHDGERDNGGVFSVSESGYMNMQVLAPRDLSAYSAFGVTVEPAGGSPGPTGPRVLGAGGT